MSHTNWLPAFAHDLYHEFFAYSWSQKGLGSLGLHVIYMSYGEQVRVDEIGQYEGTFLPFDAALGLSYGARLSDKKVKTEIDEVITNVGIESL